MALNVHVVGDADSLRDLERDLRSDIDLRGTRLARIDAPPLPGEMGVVPEALQWITENNELLAALVGAVAGWLGRQRQATRITIKLGDKVIELESDQVKDPQETADELIRQLRGPNDV